MKTLAQLLGTGALLVYVAAADPLHVHVPQGAAARWLGPLSSAAADALWLEVEGARRAGDVARLIARAELALRLDPGATEGWDFLAHHQALYLGSTLRDANPERRLDWLRGGLATARRGESVAREPEQLAYLRGVLLQTHAENDPATAWPGGTEELWDAAAAAYGEAAALGHPAGESMAAFARSEARRSTH